MSDRRDDLHDEEAPTDEERAAAERLRDALDGGGEPEGAIASLRAALGPARAVDAQEGRGELPRDVHERLLAAALGSGLDAPTQPALPPVDDAPAAPERRAAERLRERLAGDLRRDPDAEPDDPVEELVEVAAALRNAHAPRPLHDVAAARALARVSLGRAGAHRATRGARLGWGLALAAAAAAALVVLPRSGLLPASDATASLVPARSTQELFDPAEPFPREGGASDRIDRIAASRRADLRQNRFARWGIP